MERTLADLIADAAPMPSRRAAAVMVAVTRSVERVEASGSTPVGLRSTEVLLHADGSVTLAADTAEIHLDESGWSEPGTEAAASLGRLYFELLVGRVPLDRSDAFEPVITAFLRPPDCALLARSIADTPAQWPRLDEWSDHFQLMAGGLAPPVAPLERRRLRRRRLVLVAASLVLIAATAVLVLIAAPRWWDAATTDDAVGHGAPAALQRSLDSS